MKLFTAQLALSLLLAVCPAQAQTYLGQAPGAGYSPVSTGPATWTWSAGPGLLGSLPAFNTPCNPTGSTAPAQACPPVTAVPPMGISGSFPTQFLNANTADPNNNVFIGGAANGTFTGTTDIGIGNFALNGLTSATAVIAIGYNSLPILTSGGNNIGIGANVMLLCTTCSGNVGIGNSTLQHIDTDTNSIAIGQQALQNATNGTNVGIGPLALLDNTSGFNNTAIGQSSGRGITTGSQNLILGSCTGLSSSLASALVFCDGNGNVRLDFGKTTAATWTLAGGPVNLTTQLYSTTGTPTIASGACGATTNGTVGSGSTNQSGFINIGAAATTTCTLTWSATLSVAPNACVFFPGNAAAAATGTTVAWAGAPSTASVILNGSALANTVYRYQCL